MEDIHIIDTNVCMSWIFNCVDVLIMVILLDKSDLNFMGFSLYMELYRYL